MRQRTHIVVLTILYCCEKERRVQFGRLGRDWLLRRRLYNREFTPAATARLTLVTLLVGKLFYMNN